MSKVERLETLKDILTVRCKMYKDRIAFLEKDIKTREYKEIKYDRVVEDIYAFGTALTEKLNVINKRVAVIGENSYKWFVTYMATVCGAGIIVPLDKELPANEILNLIERSKTEVLVYSSKKKELIESLREKLPSNFIYIEMDKEASDETSYSFDMLVEEGKELIDTGNTRYIDMKVDKDEFRILLFTSGTTAKSKGVMLCHRNLTANIYSCAFLLPDIKDLRFFSVLPMHHTYEFMITYLNSIAGGASIAICEGLKYVVKNMQETKPSVVVAVPILVENINKKLKKAIKETGKEKLVNSLSKVATGLNKFGIDIRRIIFKKIQDNFGGNLKYFFCGAAPIDDKIVKEIESYGFNFVQGYGLTETSPLATATDPQHNAIGTVGKAVEGVEVRIDLNEGDSSGEIMIKGQNVMLGYYENEEETNNVLKKGWFYTGDLGYFDKNGNLIISGRIKNMIVTKNGKKIFPEEIEFLINRIPIISESMVYGYESADDDTDITVAAKVTLDEEYISETYGSIRPSDEEIHKIIWEEIKKINRELVSYKAVKKLEIKKDEFEKTTTLKIKRFAEMQKNK
ncbi:MAG: AMP-binding protein [Clostridia bacterium]|nr:AMP-binding protein [Clostridia bacterium]